MKINVLEYTGSYKKNMIQINNYQHITLLLKGGDIEHITLINDYGKFQGMEYKHCRIY